MHANLFTYKRGSHHSRCNKINIILICFKAIASLEGSVTDIDDGQKDEH